MIASQIISCVEPEAGGDFNGVSLRGGIHTWGLGPQGGVVDEAPQRGIFRFTVNLTREIFT